MYQQQRERAAFFVVYIAEAHSTDGWQVQANEQEGVLLREHTSFEERRAAAHLCAEQLGLSMPTLVDGMDDAACERFSAWPERIYIVGVDGRIAYKGGPGPQQFNPAEARQALEGLLG
jgi:hypothetical protein